MRLPLLVSSLLFQFREVEGPGRVCDGPWTHSQLLQTPAQLLITQVLSSHDPPTNDHAHRRAIAMTRHVHVIVR